MENAIVLLLIILSKTNAGVYFRNNDTTIREDSTTEEIIVGINSSTGSFDATVYILTVNEYIDEVGTDRLQCNSISMLLPTSYDSVEASDFATRMYTLLFNNTHQQSFNLEIVDDDLSEREETFILYINSTELDESENCAKLFTIQDNDVIMFISEPRDVNVVIGESAYFPCTYNGTKSIARWKIQYPNGTSIQVSINSLPPQHFYNDSGILVKTGVTNGGINLTTYSCFFWLSISGDLFDITSSNGTLRIVDDMIYVKFSLTTSNEEGSPIIIREGEDINNQIQITKEGQTNITFSAFISLHVVPIDNINVMELNLILPQSSVMFNSSISSINVPIQVIEDSIPESLKKFRLAIDEQIDITNDNEVRVSAEVVGPPVEIQIIDNDYVVGFDSNFTRVTEGSSVNVCISILQPLDIQKCSLIDALFVLSFIGHANETNDFNSLQIPSRTYMLNSQTCKTCTTVTSSTDGVCSTWPNYVLQVQIINNISNLSVKLMPQNVTIIVDDKDCADITIRQIIIIIASTSIALFFVSVIITIIIITIGICTAKKNIKKNKSNQKKREEA